MKLYGRVDGVETEIAGGGGGSYVQSDWSQTDSTADDYIKNKPDLTEHLPIIPTIKTATEGNVNFDDNVGTAIDVTWNGLTSFNGISIWTDGTDIYYSYSSNQYVLDKSTSTWTTKTWTGLTNFSGYRVWTDGTDIYFSDGSSQYVLDKSTSTWTAKTWTGLTSFYGNNIWTDGTDIYYSYNSSQYVLDKITSTWTTKTWNGLTSLIGERIWTDGTDIYYSDTGTNKKLINRRHINNNFITQSATLTLTVNGWDSTLKTQTVTYAHDTSKRNVIDITVSELDDWAACGVVATGETASGISFKCEEIPESALTFTVCSMSVASN